jgi:hypothetical protein
MFNQSNLNNEPQSAYMIKKFTNVRKSRSWLVAFFSFLMLFTINHAQAKTSVNDGADRPVKGKITDDKGNPIAAVSVTIKGTKKGVITNQNGDFEINVPDH